MYRKVPDTEWTIVGETYIKGNEQKPRNYKAYECICSCDPSKVHLVRKNNLDSKKSRSCGCLQKKIIAEMNTSRDAGRAKALGEGKPKKEIRREEQKLQKIIAIAKEMNSVEFIDNAIKGLKKLRKSSDN